MISKLTEKESRAALAHATHSARLEGLETTPAMFARDERILRGDLTLEQAIAEAALEAKASEQAALAKIRLKRQA